MGISNDTTAIQNIVDGQTSRMKRALLWLGSIVGMEGNLTVRHILALIPKAAQKAAAAIAKRGSRGREEKRVMVKAIKFFAKTNFEDDKYRMIPGFEDARAFHRNVTVTSEARTILAQDDFSDDDLIKAVKVAGRPSWADHNNPDETQRVFDAVTEFAQMSRTRVTTPEPFYAQGNSPQALLEQAFVNNMGKEMFQDARSGQLDLHDVRQFQKTAGETFKYVGVMSAHEVCVTVEVALNGHLRNNDDEKLTRQQREFLGEKAGVLQSVRDAATGVRDAAGSLDNRMSSMEQKMDDNLGAIAALAGNEKLLERLVTMHGTASGAAASEKAIEKLAGKAFAKAAAEAAKATKATDDPKTDSK